MLQFFYIWNEYRLSSQFMGLNMNIWLLAPRLQAAAPNPGLSSEPSVQSGALLLMIVPVIVLLIFQRFFMKDMVVTGTEK
jgi:ABC-type glycerol-3-phosphate transport system permease component